MAPSYTSNSYIWVFGFDISAPQRSNTLSYLQNGFVAMNVDSSSATPVNVPSTPVGLAVGNLVGFNVFDVSSPTSGYSPIGAILTFSNAQGKSNSNPFSSSGITLADGSTAAPQVINGSTVFSISQSLLANSAFQGASIIFGTSNSPGWNIIPPNTAITQPGSYFFTLAVIVQSKDGTTRRTFVVDPEMIFGSAG